MKILIYSIPFYPSMGGVERTTDFMGLALSELGIETTVFTETKNVLQDDPYPYAVVRSQSLIKCFRELKKNDLLIIKNGMVIKVALLACLAGCPFFVLYETSGILIQHKHNNLKTWVRNRFISYLSKRASMHLGVSQYALESKRINTKVPKKVLYNCIHPDLEPFKDLYAEKKYDFCYVGNVTFEKGVNFIVDAIKKINDSGIVVSCSFTGDGNALEYVKEAAKKYPIIARGRCAREKLAQGFVEAKCLIVGTPFLYEGFCLVCAEAFFFGLPVIAPNHTVFPEVVGDAGLFYSAGDVDQLANTMLQFINDSLSQQRLKINARQRSVKFKFDQYKVELKEKISEVLQNEN